MPHRFDFDSTRRILRGRFEGRVTDEELKEYYLAAGKHVAQADAALASRTSRQPIPSITGNRLASSRMAL
jgi:3-hydroxyacyl-CoA dehydrogenase